MADVSDIKEWFFDLLIGFLRSPMWRNPIESFIDENCLIFDGEEENEFSYTLLHKQVRNIYEIPML